MKTAFGCLVAMAAVFTTAMAAYDADFCSKSMAGKTQSPNPDMLPSFFDNFYVFIEMKRDLSSNVINIEEMYSKQAGRVFMSMDNVISPYQVWIDSWNDQLMVGPHGTDDVCEDFSLEGSDPAVLIGATTDENGKIVLSDPGVALHWDPSVQKQLIYIGENIIRGINVLEYWTCEYYDYVDATTFTKWYFIDSTKSSLPLQNQKMLPVAAITEGTDHENKSSPLRFQYRYDFTHFNTISSDDEGFQVPASMLCAGKGNKLIKPLPTMPDYFRFRGEQNTVMPPQDGSQDPAVHMTYVIEEYYHTLKLFLKDLIQTPNDMTKGNEKAYIRQVDDFNTGIRYSMDLTTGDCFQSTIPTDDIDSIAGTGGLAQMRDPSQFFDLDYDKFQYMGVHTVRGIQCDTWGAKYDENKQDHHQGTLNTYYFATSDWMTQNGYAQAFTMPVALTVTEGDTMVFLNFFEFTEDFDKEFPDVSSCYDQDSVTSMEIFFQGRYDKYFSIDPFAFRHAFLTAMLEYTGLMSALRISNLDIQPADNNEIVVRFELLEKVNQQGNVANPLDSDPSSRIMDQIVTKVNAGKFALNVGDTGSVRIYARKQSAGKTTRGSVFSSTSNSDGFSAGAMAGIGVGMLILGAVLGGVIVFLVKKFRGGGGGGDFGMNKFSEDSES